MSESVIQMVISKPQQTVATICSGIGIWVVWKLTNWFLQRKRMRAKIELKWKQRQNHQRVLKARLEQLGQTELWQTISSKSYQVLKEELQTGKLKAVDALRAYQWQAIQSNQTRNNVVWFIEDAEELAAKLDATPEQDRGPMHGIPISVKECYFVKNCDATGGMCQYAHLPVTEDSLAVQLMKSFGAIPYVLTNVPQSMFSLQCSNPLYGVTGNALDPQREAGGSSGGEGSLIGSGGSILGLGSDVGGSLRNPAVFNGIYSLKPTHGRHLSQCGVRNPVEYETIGISCVGGFMSSSAKAVQDAYKILYENIDKSALKDQSIAPVQWRPALNQTRMLKIGYFMTDGKFQSHPGCTRAVKETVAKLKKMGHEVIEFHGPDSERVSDLYLGLMFQDRFKRAYGALSKDVFIDSAVDGVWISAWIMKCPDWIRQWIINPLASLLTSDLPPDPIEDGTTIPPALAEMDTILKEYMNEWDEFNLDLVLTAASYMPPPLKEIIGQMPSSVRPYIPWNLLNLPAGIVPMSKVTKEDDFGLKSLPNNDMFYRIMKKSCQGAVGMPLAVQIVGRRYQEELILSLMTQLAEVSEM